MDLTGLSPITTAATALANLILVTPQQTVGYQPQVAPSYQNSTAKPGKAFLFSYEGEQTVTLESDITDHFIENNSAIQDQVALKPVLITTQGFVGELNDVSPAALLPLKIAATKLTPINVYTPSLSAAAILAYNEAAFLYQVGQQVTNAAVGAWASINGDDSASIINGSGQAEGSNQNKQQIAFNLFYGYYASRTLFTVQTPWAVFQDMIIKTLRAVQDPDTKTISNFEITFKMLRFASAEVTQRQIFNTSAMQTRAKTQGSSIVDIGTSAPKTATKTLSEGIAGSIA